LLYFLVPAICVAVLGLGAAALRTTLQVEKARQQTVFDATWTLASDRIDRLEKMIIAQDNVVSANVDVGALATIAYRWLPTARRETPTVRAVMVLDATTAAMEVRAFVSKGRFGAQDDAFRRVLVHRLIPRMDLSTPPVQQLRHLHRSVEGKSYLTSYWQRAHAGRRYLVVAWHDVERLVNDVMPQLYRDFDRNSRMNVTDQQGRILFGPPIHTNEFTVGRKFPTTLYNWRLQVALTSAEDLAEKAVRQRLVQIGVVALAVLIAVVGTVIVGRAAVEERRLATLRGDFVANVSHELKTPLASVRMFGELLLTGRVANDDKRHEYLQIIVGESERLSNLIGNVLDFAKVEKGKDAYDFVEGDLATVVARAVDTLNYRAERQGIELCSNLEPAPCVLDERSVELAVINLIDNALKYAKGSDVVQVSAKGDAGAEAVLVRVEDSGPGIDSTDRDRIFDRFVRGRGAQEAHVRGSGIGLALVKHIADAHGGSVRVESPVDGERGSAFEIRLPLKPPGV